MAAEKNIRTVINRQMKKISPVLRDLSRIMAETVLPACLESLKIDLSGDASTIGLKTPAPINPFSNVGGARKKIRRLDIATPEGQCSCPLGLFGKKCSKSKSNMANCVGGCYVQSKFEQNSKQCVKLQTRPTSSVKRNIICKSKLNFFRSQYSKKQGSQNANLMSLLVETVNVSTTIKSSDPNHETANDLSTTLHASENNCPNTRLTPNAVQKSKLFGNCVLNGKDFQSLLSSTDKQKSVFSPSFDTASFRSIQKQRLRTTRNRRREKRTSESSDDEDENVSKVSKKLAVIGVGLTANSNASCSQQARLTANAYCDENDISIDELAGYFEDYVHIPKKMSVMAEQMYI